MRRRQAIALLALAGLFVSLYLWLHKLGLIGVLQCGTGGCDTVQASRYAEFLGTASIDHVVAQALQFIFKRDSQFKSWLEQNPVPTQKPVRQRASSKTTNGNGGGQ